MRGLLSLLYGVAAYTASLAALLYLIGFCGNLLVPRSVDIGPDVPWAQALSRDLLLLALFGVQHSVMARRGFKRWWTRIVPGAVERSTYVLATCVVLGMLYWLWAPVPAPVMWRVDGPGATLLWSLFGLGWALVIVSTFLINHFELFGLSQVFATLSDRAMPASEFKTPFLYRCVRHPLYLGLLLAFWCSPVMSLGHLFFSLGASIYVFVGIWFEERDLVAQFGERYRRYRERVGMVLPRLRRART